MKALGNELGAFMMRIVDGRLARHIMKTHMRLPGHLHDVDNVRDVGGFSAIRISNVNVNAKQKETRRVKNKPIRDQDKRKLLRM
jgi:hypothetical protein